MKSHHVLGVVCAVSLIATSVQAAPPTTLNEALAAIQQDSTLISGWTSQQFKRAIPYNSTAGDVVPSQFSVLGFDIGVQAVVTESNVDKDSFHNLGTTVVDTRQIDMFDRMPLPNLMGHATIGLPWGFDLGLRLGGIPKTDVDHDDTHGEITNSIFGVDVRKALIEEGMTRPFGLTLGLNFTRAKGHIVLTTPYEANLGSDVTLTDAVGEGRTDWDTNSMGLQAIMNKKIAFFNPYIGTAVNKNWGSVESSLTNTGTINSVNGVTYNQTFTSVGTGSAEPDSWDFRGMFGAEFTLLPFLRFGIGGEVASEHNVAGHLGLRFQFR